MSFKKIVFLSVLMAMPLHGQYSKSFLKKKKKEVTQKVADRHKQSQVMVDKIFSFAELGFHEVESSTYLTGLLEKAGFEITYGLSGIPTAWMAQWTQGKGGPVIALGSDVDCIPKASQYPGVAYHKPMVEGAPGHGEGHNAGIPLNITAALSVQEIMKKRQRSRNADLMAGHCRGTRCFQSMVCSRWIF
jgi:aminobenzoyl-glutamate utilization protein B